mmetsp:Transcript_16984/g.36584  ORF Transcript_16984/g.36584 Transcript_16984/m.36584 type:complete len:117 (-) Transcript_16984:114-464(-)
MVLFDAARSNCSSWYLRDFAALNKRSASLHEPIDPDIVGVEWLLYMLPVRCGSPCCAQRFPAGRLPLATPMRKSVCADGWITPLVDPHAILLRAGELARTSQVCEEELASGCRLPT